MSRVAKKRLVAVRTVQALVSAGESLGDACFDAGISVAQFRRWSRRIDAAVLEALKDAPRCGGAGRNGGESLATGKFIMSEVFSRIDDVRRKKGVSYKKLAEICGVSPQNVQRWKTGGNIMPEHISKLAMYFGVTTDWLLIGREGVNAAHRT